MVILITTYCALFMRELINMTWAIIQRGSGEFRGPPIVDALITEDYVAVDRGRSVLDSATAKASVVTLTTIYRIGVRSGHLVKVLDALQGVLWFGKVIGIQQQINNPVDSKTILPIESAQ